jgi:hypothetical protein
VFIQLSLDFTTRPRLQKEPIIQNSTWLDVSQIARGVGFTGRVQVSNALNDALEPFQNEIDSDYDQRLYDALWQAHFQLSLDRLRSATFNFSFTRRHGKPGEMYDVSLRLHAEIEEDTIYLGRLEDFWGI